MASALPLEMAEFDNPQYHQHHESEMMDDPHQGTLGVGSRSRSKPALHDDHSVSSVELSVGLTKPCLMRLLNGSDNGAEAVIKSRLEWFSNFVLVFVSVLGCSAGGALLALYRIHLLTFISMEFLIVPLMLVGCGALTLTVSFVGLFTFSRPASPCLMRFYAVCLTLTFLVLLGGVTASLKTVFTIHVMGLDGATASWKSLAQSYGRDPQATQLWDTLQRTFRCCGAETSYELGYLVWHKNPGLAKDQAVPDTCCLDLVTTPGCGHGIFVDQNSGRKMVETVRQIHVHGCVRAVEAALKGHVSPILLTFAICGSVLGFLELLGVVSAFCLAKAIQKSLTLEKKNEEAAKRKESSTYYPASDVGSFGSLKKRQQQQQVMSGSSDCRQVAQRQSSFRSSNVQQPQQLPPPLLQRQDSRRKSTLSPPTHRSTPNYNYPQINEDRYTIYENARENDELAQMSHAQHSQKKFMSFRNENNTLQL